MDAQHIADRICKAAMNDDLYLQFDLVDEVEDLAYEYDNLKTENEKLREFVLDLCNCSYPCLDCPHYVSGAGFYCDLGLGWKSRRMRELGIEVDE